MRTKNLIQTTFTLIAMLSIGGRVSAQKIEAGNLTGTSTAVESKSLQVPARPSASLYAGEQGAQKTDIYFDPATDLVTIKMLVQDPSGFFIPNIRRENFAVYENGARQHNATVEIEHSPVTLAVLLEWGGRYQVLNRTLANEVPRAARQLFDEIGREDKIAIYKYGDRVTRVADFSTGREALDGLFIDMGKPEFSELNLYDALVSTIESMKTIRGRKAILLVSSGFDTFSRARYQDALAAARDGGTPVYVVDIAPDLCKALEQSPSQPGPYARIDWSQAEMQLQAIAKSSGGRQYPVESLFDLPGVYDDLMENLRVRYVITYKSATGGDRRAARSVRIDLIDPATGGPLEIIDANHKPVQSKLSFENSYIPARTPLVSLSAAAPRQ